MQRTRLALGFCRGPWRLALDYDACGGIIDQFAAVPVPNAPPWLCGVTSHSGGIFPIIDLERYFDENALGAPPGGPQRLLMTSDAAQDPVHVALLFNGLPVQLRGDLSPSVADGGHPLRLSQLAEGRMQDRSGAGYLRLDAPKLIDALYAHI